MALNGISSKVVIIGGGYSGIAIAKLLDQDFDVTLIEKRRAFFHNLAALRAVVEPTWLDKLFIPYDALLKRGKILHNVVVEATPTQVHLDHGETQTFDYLVLATGSSYPFPAKMSSHDVESSKHAILRLHERLHSAKRILIAGGGPVGVELAGEIASKYPQKAITLVHTGKTLIGKPFNPKLGERLLEDLKALGVNVLLGEKVFLEGIRAEELTQTRTYSTDQGKNIETDVLFICYGANVNNDYLRTHFAGQLDQQGRVIVNSQMQVEGYNVIFAVGDLTNIDEPKMGFLGEGHASVVAANIKAMHLSKRQGRLKRLRVYKPAKRLLMIVPLGEQGGAGQLPLTRTGVIVGALLTKHIKGKTLLAQRYWAKMGLEMPR